MLNKNDVAPGFRLPNEDGVEISLDDLKDHTVVLYFYPKDNTSGCTLQATDFTSYIDEFRALNTVVVGVSPDSIESHKRFVESRNLKVTLLSDEDREVAKRYSAFGTRNMYGKEVQGIIRSIFVIKEGKIEQPLYNVKAKGSALRTLEYLRKMIPRG